MGAVARTYLAPVSIVLSSNRRVGATAPMYLEQRESIDSGRFRLPELRKSSGGGRPDLPTFSSSRLVIQLSWPSRAPLALRKSRMSLARATAQNLGVELGERLISKADETPVRKFDLGIYETDSAKWGVERLSRFLKKKKPRRRRRHLKSQTSDFLGRPKD